MVAVAHCRRADTLEVRSGRRLGHGNGADQFAGSHARQVFLLEELAAVMQQVRCDDLRMQQHPEQVLHRPARWLLEEHDAVKLVGAGAAVLLGHRGA